MENRGVKRTGGLIGEGESENEKSCMISPTASVWGRQQFSFIDEGISGEAPRC